MVGEISTGQCADYCATLTSVCAPISSKHSKGNFDASANVRHFLGHVLTGVVAIAMIVVSRLSVIVVVSRLEIKDSTNRTGFDSKMKKNAIKIGISEDCAGLSTAAQAAQLHLQDSEAPDDLQDENNFVKLVHVHASEENDSLRAFIGKRFKYKNLQAKAQQKPKGISKKVAKELMDIYTNGFPCQHFPNRAMKKEMMITWDGQRACTLRPSSSTSTSQKQSFTNKS